jgi:hypothetical protein
MTVDLRKLRMNISIGCKSPVVRYFVNELFATDDYNKIYSLQSKLRRFIISKRMSDGDVAVRFGDILLTPGKLGVFDVYALTLIFGSCGSSAIKFVNESRNAFVVSVPSNFGVAPLWVLAIEGGEGTKGNSFVHSGLSSFVNSSNRLAQIVIAENTVPMKNETIAFEAVIDVEEWKEFSNTYISFDSERNKSNLKLIDAKAYLFLKAI